MRRNQTIDCMSPLVVYQTADQWRDGTSEDSLANRYAQGGTFRLSTDKGASASVGFNGTGVWIFGAKRGNHGPYAGSIDNGSPQVTDGFASNPEQFQTVLYGVQSLAPGPHTVTISNQLATTTRPYLDIDFVVFETNLPDTATSTTVIDDAHAAFEWLPSASTWSTSCSSLPTYSSGSCHASSSPESSARLSFIGDAVTVFGAVGPDHGPYVVQLDSQPSARFNAHSTTFHAQQIIYYADNLGPGKHTITIANNPANSGDILDIDYIQIIGSNNDPTNLNSTTSSDGTPNSSEAQTTPKSNTGAIVGGIIGGLVCLFAFAAAWYFFHWRPRRNLRIRSSTHLDMASHPFQDGDAGTIHTYPLGPSAGYGINYSVSGQSVVQEASDVYRDPRGYAYSVEPPTTVPATSVYSPSEDVHSHPPPGLVPAAGMQVRNDRQSVMQSEGGSNTDSSGSGGQRGTKSAYVGQVTRVAEGTGNAGGSAAHEQPRFDPPPQYS